MNIAAIGFFILAPAAAFLWFKKWILQKRIERLESSEQYLMHTVNGNLDKFNEDIERIQAERRKELEEKDKEIDEINREINSLNFSLQEKIEHISYLNDSAKLLQEELKFIKDLNSNVIQQIRNSSPLLPHVIEWVDKLQEASDSVSAEHLLTKRNPAVKSSETLREVQAEARNLARQVTAYRNRVFLYEAQAPWLEELINAPLSDVLEGLSLLEKEAKESTSGKDPVSLYLTSEEYSNLTHAERNQLALDRYFEKRQASPFLAGIMYERYVGYQYEKEGFDVFYNGARNGYSDYGVDLICTKNEKMHLVQCKRLSIVKAIPVRERVVAQLYGAALVVADIKEFDTSATTPVIVTSYQLSDDAKYFARKLGVKYREMVALDRYPCIKCNISKTGERIYHLPFDQQYDNTKITAAKGEMYALTIAEAEANGFRRAFRWTGGA